MLSSLTDPAVRRRTVVLVASLLFMLIGTGSIYFIVIALKPIALEFVWPRAVPSIAYALQYAGAGVGASSWAGASTGVAWESRRLSGPA